MKKTISILIGCTFFLMSCVSYNPDAFLRKQTINNQLSPITPLVVWDQFGSNELSENVREVMAKSYQASFNDPNNIQFSDSRYGFAVFNLELVGQSAGFIWLFPVVATLGISVLIGIPAGSQTAKTKIKMDLLDANLNTISSFEAEGEEIVYGALYWGYNPIGVANYAFGLTCTDVSVTKSFMAAFDVLGKKINENSEEINRKLAEAGPNKMKTYKKLDNIYAGINVFKTEEGAIWKIARKENTKDAYNLFVDLFPKSTLSK